MLIIIIVIIIIIIIIIYLPRLNTVHLRLQQHHLARTPHIAQETVRLTTEATTNVNIFASEIHAAPLRLSHFRMV